MSFVVRVAHSMRGVYGPFMIHPYDNATQTRWDHGEFKVQLMSPNSSRPIGFCDGSDADVAELKARAEAEGMDSVAIHKKALKSAREIWTVGDVSSES